MEQGDIVLVRIADSTSPALILSNSSADSLLLLPIGNSSSLKAADFALLSSYLHSGRLLQSARVQIDSAFSLPRTAIGKTVASLKRHILEEILHLFQERITIRQAQGDA